jgi:hypothetical protein
MDIDGGNSSQRPMHDATATEFYTTTITTRSPQLRCHAEKRQQIRIAGK